MPNRIVLIVDDNPQNLVVLGELLTSQYQVRAANSGARALQVARQQPLPDLILLDVMMPDIDGFEVLTQLRADELTRDIPVIFVTAMGDFEDENRGLSLGAVDYIAKPLRPALVLARVRTHLALKHTRDMLLLDKQTLEREIERRMHETLLVQEVGMRALARLAETRDNETGQHLLRTQASVLALARRVRHHPRFAAELNDVNIDLIAKSAPLHDIGKVGIPDHVLLKPSPLTPAEWEIMRQHARLGAEAIDRAVADTHQPVPFLGYARQIALHHHERWDGGGYPCGLAGDAIPLAARLMAVADVFDALISSRVYKAPMSFERARSIMLAQRGRHFDPDLLDAFIDGFDEFCRIARNHPDEDEPADSASARFAAMAAVPRSDACAVLG
jgi:putative two-component system response regulator